jgi:hypothetical protein
VVSPSMRNTRREATSSRSNQANSSRGTAKTGTRSTSMNTPSPMVMNAPPLLEGGDSERAVCLEVGTSFGVKASAATYARSDSRANLRTSNAAMGVGIPRGLWAGRSLILDDDMFKSLSQVAPTPLRFWNARRSPDRREEAAPNEYASASAGAAQGARARRFGAEEAARGRRMDLALERGHHTSGGRQLICRAVSTARPIEVHASLRVFRSPRGALLIEMRSMKTFSTVVIGKLDPPLVAQLLDVLERWLSLAGDKLAAFFDWEDVTDGDGGGGVELLTLLAPHRRRFTAIHFLLRSPIARAQVRDRNVAFQGSLLTYGWRAEFERVLSVAT